MPKKEVFYDQRRLQGRKSSMATLNAMPECSIREIKSSLALGHAAASLVGCHGEVHRPLDTCSL